MYDVYNMYHSGILGMHWGIRRYQYKDGSLTPEGRKRYAKLEKQLSKTKNEKKASKIQAELDKLSGKMKEEKVPEKKFDLKSISDTDLNAMLNRMQMEKRYYELSADLAEKTKTPEQRKLEEKIRRKEAFKQNLIDTMQRTGLEVLQQGTKKLANNALDSLFEDAKKANEKNNKKEKSTTDLIKDEQLKQMRLKTEQAERENAAAKQAAKEAKKQAKAEKKAKKNGFGLKPGDDIDDDLDESIGSKNSDSLGENRKTLRDTFKERRETKKEGRVWDKTNSETDREYSYSTTLSDYVANTFKDSNISMKSVNDWSSSSGGSSSSSKKFADSLLSSSGDTPISTVSNKYKDVDYTYSSSASKNDYLNAWGNYSKSKSSMTSINNWSSSSASASSKAFVNDLFSNSDSSKFNNSVKDINLSNVSGWKSSGSTYSMSSISNLNDWASSSSSTEAKSFVSSLMSDSNISKKFR